MADDMGTFRVSVEIENPERPGTRRRLDSVVVDTGAVLSWFPAAMLDELGIERHRAWRFRQADGAVLERWTGPAYVHVAGVSATDDVVFGEPGDLILLGSLARGSEPARGARDEAPRRCRSGARRHRHLRMC